jgi:AAA+ superfamily predicted ATPase
VTEVSDLRKSPLPDWLPRWARQMAELYFSGTTAAFILHGNTDDLFRTTGDEVPRYGALSEFLVEQLFGRWAIVLHYDIGQGLRAYAGRNETRLKEMVPLINRKIGDLSTLAKDPGAALAMIDRFVRNNIIAADADRVSFALLLNQASTSSLPASRDASAQASSQLVTLLNWASSPQVKQLNMAFVLIDEKLNEVSARLAGSPHVAAIEVPLPDEKERAAFARAATRPPLGRDLASFSDFGVPELATLTAGITLADLNVLVQSAEENGQRLDTTVFRALKKRLIERQCRDLLEFMEPKWTLDTIVGHEAAKTRPAGRRAQRGALDTLPRVICSMGPVGTGNRPPNASAARSVFLRRPQEFPVEIRGETEGNLERVLSVLRAMGPVVVVVDEADAALGSRESDGDSGTSSRVFGMIASQMGDTKYRGRILWMLLTARPDLLPIDLKRQGRAEVHIPLFYPTDEAEIRQLFVVLAKKLGSTLRAEDIPPIPQRGHLSGADIEGMVGRAWRVSLLAGADHVTKEALADVVSQFLPSTQGLERELQEVAAILECTDSQFLPPAVRDQIAADGGRGKLQARMTALKQIVKGL